MVWTKIYPIFGEVVQPKRNNFGITGRVSQNTKIVSVSPGGTQCAGKP